MSFSNGQLVAAADLNNLSVDTVTTTGDVSVGDDLAVADDATIGGDLVVTGSVTAGGTTLSSVVTKDIVCGRLSLTTGTPITTGDVTAATTLFFALYEGDQIALYSGTQWLLFSIAQLSIAVPSTTAQMYDVFVDYNSGTPALAVTAWTNDTTRATALTKQDGVLVLTGELGKRYVGSFRTTGVSGQTEDSFANRFVWNYYHRVPRLMRVTEATNSWTQPNATWRQANSAGANQLAFVIGVAEVSLDATVAGAGTNVGAVEQASVAVGLDSTTVPTTGNIGMSASLVNTSIAFPRANLQVYPAVGYHYAAWLESGGAAGGAIWYGDNNTPTLLQSGIFGVIQG